jgi:hypothetical protein
VVVGAVHKKRGLFAVFRDIDQKDLLQEGMMRAAIMHKTYDDRRHKGQTIAPGRLPKPYSTWITLGVNRCILDIWRKRSRQAKRDSIAAAISVERTRQAEAEDASVPWPDEPRSLAWWLRDVYAKAVAARPPTIRRGPKGFSPAVAVAIGALMARMKLSTRAAAMFLAEKPEILVALGLKKAPSQRWLVKARNVAAKSCSDNSRIRRPRGFKE